MDVPASLPPKRERDMTRAGLDPRTRLILTTGFTLFWGCLLGARRGGQMASLQYLAENAHRTPKTLEGWYLYKKRKNYHVMYWGIRRGLREGVRLASWTAVYGLLEVGADRLNGGKAYAIHSVAAGMATGGLVALRYRLSRRATRQALMFGALLGGLCGMAQELSLYLGDKDEAKVAEMASETPSSDSPTPPEP